MIVFDLKCVGSGHVFEAWFVNSDAFVAQQQARQVACPYCGDTEVEKAVMAPRVGAKGNNTNANAAFPVAKPAEPAAEEVKTFLAKIAQAQADILKTSQWVGRDFDTQARAMDSGEIDKSSIHGEVSPEEAKALIEDGIGVMPLPFPVVPPSKRN